MSQSGDVQLFKKQEKVYPKRVWGRYRKLKWIAMIVLLGIYYLTPWLRWDRGPHAPDQAILIDMPARRAYFFFIEIWPQEVYYLTGVLILAAVGLFFVTSLFGRVWCGYACPQTVWTDLFVWVERIVIGDRNARKKMAEGSWTLKKIWKTLIVHSIWLVIALLTGGAWVFYFNDAPTLMDQIIHFDLSPMVWGWILALTFSTYLMAGFAREQVCTYMCPYARFQSAMFDKSSLIIGYDAERGEPRGKHKKDDSWDGRGHCVDCSLCVQVCPTGIDIRNGLQMECIACGLCVDACNGVMDKLGLPRGLVRYDTVENQERRQAGLQQVQHLLRPRTFYYAGIMLVVSSVMLYSLLTRDVFDLTVLHDRNPLFVTLSNGDIRNGYNITILNKSHDDKTFSLSIEGLEGAELKLQGTGDVSSDHILVLADKVGHLRLFVSAPIPAVEGVRHEVEFILTDLGSGELDTYRSVFVTGRPR